MGEGFGIGKQIPVSDEELRKFGEDKRLIHFAGLINPPRPGVRLFAVKLEYFYFEPGTPKNDEYIFHIVNWEEMVWGVISIPKEYMDLAKKVAAEAGLRIADGTPHMIIGGGQRRFPMNTNNVFTLENVSDHLVYKNDPQTMFNLFAKENYEMDEIFKKQKSSRGN